MQIPSLVKNKQRTTLFRYIPFFEHMLKNKASSKYWYVLTGCGSLILESIEMFLKRYLRVHWSMFSAFALHTSYYFLSSSHLLIWVADKRRLPDDSSFFPPPLQPASVHPSFLFPGKERQDGECLYPFFFKFNVRSRSVALTVSEPPLTGSYSSSFAAIDLCVNSKQSVINSEPPDKVSSSLFVPSLIWY